MRQGRRDWAAGVVLVLALAAFSAGGQEPGEARSEEQERALRERYEEALRRSPFQEQAFNRVYESYLVYDGLPAWVEKLEAGLEGSATKQADLVLLGRIRARQFNTPEAIQALEDARASGAADPELDILLGTLYYESGKNEAAAELLNGALESVEDPDTRGRICRILGSLYLREGNREAAVAAWQRLVAQDSKDEYALMELADVYRENRMWPEAVETLHRLIAASEANPYRRCWAWRAVGDCLMQLEKPAEAIAAYEQGLELAAPGNWLAEDLKGRLVSVYQDQGDLQGLLNYAQARVQADPGDLEFRELAAETHARMGHPELAEAEYRQVLERAPDRFSTYEKLIALYRATNQPARARETLEQLVALAPNEPDYLRRLGEAVLQEGQPEPAKEVWRRAVAGPDVRADDWALLAGWLEQYEFPDDAIQAYEQAVALEPNKEWVFRLAALRHEKGEEDEAVRLWKSVLTETSTGAEYAEVASLLLTYGRKEDAEPLLKKAVELEPDKLEHAASLARLLMDAERHEEAVPLYTRMAEATDNGYFQGRGEEGLIEAYTAMGVLEQKEQEWRAEVEANPQAVAPMLRLARLYRHGGNLPGAVELYKRCTEVEPGNPEHLRLLAEAYRDNRQMDQSVEAYKRLVELDATRAGGHLRELLQMYVRLNKKEEAVSTAEKIVELAPGDPDARLDLAQVYQVYGKTEESLQQYRHALRLEPDEPDFHRQYGDALSGQGRWGEAQEAYRRMLEHAREDATRLDAVSRLGNVHLQQGKIEELLREFEGRVRNAPKKLAAYQELAALYRASGNPARALEVLDEAAAAVDEKAEALRLVLGEAQSLGELQKAAAVLEQLMALGGETSLFELERLGSVYAQLGDYDRAKEAWKRITEKYPQDPAAHEAVARALFQAGFVDESFAAQAKALELDPYDYRLRYAFAQQLANHERLDEAMAQLQKLLELGEGPQAAPPSPIKEKKVRPLFGQPGPMGGYYPGGLRRGRMAFAGSYMMPQTYGWGGYGWIQWQGSFEDFRPNVLATMVQMARRLNDVDSALAFFQEAVEAQPENFEAKLDLIAALTAAERREEALAQAEALSASRPDDLDLLVQTASLYERSNQLEKALEKYQQVAAKSEERRAALAHQIMSLHIRTGKQAEALAMAEAMMAEKPDDPGVAMAVGGVFQQAGKMEEAKALYAKAAEQYPAQYLQFKNMLANLAIQLGQIDEAWAIQESLLFGEVPPALQQGPVRQPTLQVYSPMPPRMGRQQYNEASYVMHTFMPSGAGHRVQALQQLVRYSLQDERLRGVLQRLEDAAAGHGTGDDAQNAQALEMGKLLIAFRTAAQDHEGALGLVTRLREAGATDPELLNIELFLREQLGQYDAMEPLFAALESRYPAQAASIRRGRLTLALMKKDYATVEAQARELFRQPGQSQEVYGLLNALQQAGEKDLVRRLAEEYMAGKPRDIFLLNMLAGIYAEQGDSDKAIAVARQAFDMQPPATSGMTNWQWGYHGGPTPRSQSLEQLAHVYERANRLPELVKEFEDKLAKQPASVQLHEDLALLYRRSNEAKKANELYRKLLALRPNNNRVRMALAESLKKSGEIKAALDIYEEMLRRQPSLYSGMQWEIRQLYQQMGKTKELTALEERIIQQSPSPDVLQHMAWEAQNRGDFKRAAELWEKMIAADPRQTHFYTQLANVYAQSGREEDALKAYRRYFDASRGVGWHDPGTLRQMVVLYDRMGRLDELKAETEKEIAGAPPSGLEQMTKVQIARHENRLDDAMALLEALLQSSPGNSMAMMEMVSVAEEKGDLDKAIELLERSAAAMGHRDFQRLANLYVKKGDREKALEYWEKHAVQQGGSYAHAHVVRELIRNKMWDEAAAYYARCKEAALRDPDAYRQLAETMVEAYASSGKFKEIVEGEILTADYPYADQFIRRLLYSDALKPADLMRIVAPLKEKFGDKPEFLEPYAQFLEQMGEYEEAAGLYKKLAEMEGENTYRWSQYAQCLQQCGKLEEAIPALVAWVEAKPQPQRINTLAQYLQQLGRAQEMLELRDRLVEKAAPEEQERLRVLFALPQAQAGDPQGAHERVKSWFEKAPDAERFVQYAGFLSRQGLKDEVYDLVKANKDREYFSWGAVDLAMVLWVGAAREDWEFVDGILWEFWQSEDPNNIVHRMRQFSGASSDVEEAVAERLEARVRKEEPDNTEALAALAQLYAQMDRRAKALELWNEVLEKEPGRREWRQRRRQVLEQMGRPSEIIALLEAEVKETPPQVDLDAHMSLARRYFQAGRPEDAEAILKNLNAGGGQQYAQAVGSVYYAAKMYDKAAAAYEEARKQMGSEQAPHELIACYVHLGRLDEAKALWGNVTEGYQVATIGRALMEAKQYEVAQEFFASHRDVRNRDTEVYGMHAKALLECGDREGYREVFAQAEEERRRGQGGSLLYEYGRFLAENGMLAEAVASEAFLTDRLLQQAAARALTLEMKQEELPLLAKQIAEKLAGIEDVDVETANVLAQALTQADDKALEAEWWVRVAQAKGAQPWVRQQALAMLAQAEAWDKALPLCEALVEERPQVLVEYNGMIQVLAKAGKPEVAEALFGRLAESGIDPAKTTYARAMYDWACERKTEAAAAVKTLEASTVLTTFERMQAARLFIDTGEPDTAFAWLEKAYEVSPDANTRMSVAQESVNLASQAGDGGRALKWMARIPVMSDADQLDLARNRLSEGTTAEHLPGMLAALKELATAEPENARLSDVVGLYCQIAQRFDQAASPAQLAAELGLAEKEAADCRVWEGLIETWAITGTEPLKEGQQGMEDPVPAEVAAVAEGKTAMKDSPLPWRTTDPKEHLGLIRVDKALELQQDQMNNAAAYAVAVIDSPDDRTVTFAHGSDDWVCIWINGEKVHSQLRGRSAVVDQDKFTAPLKAGRNTVVMKIGNNYSDWQFSLAPIEGAEGLTCSVPE